MASHGVMAMLRGTDSPNLPRLPRSFRLDVLISPAKPHNFTGVNPARYLFLGEILKYFKQLL